MVHEPFEMFLQCTAMLHNDPQAFHNVSKMHQNAPAWLAMLVSTNSTEILWNVVTHCDWLWNVLKRSKTLEIIIVRCGKIAEAVQIVAAYCIALRCK